MTDCLWLVNQPPLTYIKKKLKKTYESRRLIIQEFRFRLFFHTSKNPGFIVICIICTISSHSSPPKKLQFLPYFPIQETCELLQSQIPRERCWTFKTLPEKCSHSIDGLKPIYVGCCSPESEVAGKLFGDDNIFAQCTCF